MDTLTPIAPSKEAATGRAVDRVDGKLKVTGGARYAAEFSPDGVTYGVLVLSTESKGRIKSIDTKAALAAPGVLKILTSENMPKLGK